MNESEQTDDPDKIKISGLQLLIWHSSDSLKQAPETLLWHLPSGHCFYLWRRALLQNIFRASSSSAGLGDVSKQSLSVHRILKSAIWVAPHLSQGSQTEQTCFMVRFPPWFPHVQVYGDDTPPQGNHVLAPTALSQHLTLLQSCIAMWCLLQFGMTPKCPYDSWYLVGHPGRHRWRDDVSMLFLEQEELPGTGFLSNGHFFIPSRYICSGGKDIDFRRKGNSTA